MCNQETGGVNFTWDPVAGATGYEVIVTSTDPNGDLHTGTLSGETFTVTGLANGESVSIDLIIMTGDECQTAMTSYSGCILQDCVAPTVELDAGNGPDALISICTADFAGPFDIDFNIVSGETGTGEFSGPGITDVVAGTFDPAQANVGINNITYSFMTDDVIPCLGSGLVQIEIIETPVASFTTSEDWNADDFPISYKR